MSEIIIREIEEEDLDNGFLEVLDNLRKASDLENPKAKEVLKKIKQNENHIIHVAMDGNKVVGSTTLFIEQKFIHQGGLVGHIEDVVVRKDYEGTGIGIKLVLSLLEYAKKISSEIGIKHIVIEYNELDNESFVKNDNNRCFYCRSELSQHLLQVAKEFESGMIVDGTNIDDLGDYRPGVLALRQNGIRSPLAEAGFSKKMVREAAKMVGLSVYDKPSNSCLASRIPWGQSVTAERLARIEIGEKIVKQLTGAKQVRVRDMDGIAKIEVGVDELSVLENNSVLEKIKEQLKLISFEDISIDPEGYRPGKINVITN